MSWDMAETTQQKARKDYSCGACEWVRNAEGEAEFSPEDLVVIESAKADNWLIKKGSDYTKTKGKWEGEFTEFRARLDMDSICINHNLYPEE